MESLKKYTTLILILIFAFATAGVYFLWIPKYEEYKDSNQMLKSKLGEFERKSAYLSDIEAKLSALSDYNEELQKINAAIPVYDFSEVSLLAFIQKVSSENGMVLKNIDTALQQDKNSSARQSLGNSTESPGAWKIRSFVFNAEVSGSYSSFKDFIKAIYMNSRMVEVDSITFASADKEGKYDFDLELNANYYVWEKLKPVSAAVEPGYQ